MGFEGGEAAIMLNLVFLPATDPQDTTYGTIPKQIIGHKNVAVHRVYFPNLVWYNEAVRTQAIEQIDSLRIDFPVLVGFSKSGLGAFNIARMISDQVAGAIIFDAPVARMKSVWNTAEFYPNDESWLADIPVLHLSDIKNVFKAAQPLILISGMGFHNEMVELSRLLHENSVNHTFLPHPDMKHHWNSGWIEEAVDILLKK